MRHPRRHGSDGMRHLDRGKGPRVAAVMMAASLAACAGLPVEQVGDLRRQVDQLARQRSDLVQVARSLAADGQEGHAAGPLEEQGSGAGTGTSDILERYRRGYALYHQGDYVASASALRAFLSAAPGDHPAAADARYWIGECYFARGLYREAIGAWGKLAEAHDETSRPDRAWLRIGSAYARLGETEMARLAFLKVTRTWPDGDSAPQATEELGLLPEDH